MAQPTQVLPPWLSPALTTLVLPQTTEITTTLVFLPLTYYGPSIPLDADFTYGGLTSPVSTSTAAASTTSSSATTSSSSSATPPSLSSSSSVSTVTPLTSASASASPPASSSASAAASSTPLSRAQLIGIVIGSVLGALVLFLFVLCIAMRIGRRRNGNNDGEQSRTRTPFTLLPRRRTRARTRFTMVTPPVPGADNAEFVDDDWLMVASQSPTSVGSPTSPQSPQFPGGQAVPGRGGTEADPFLTRLPNPHSGALATHTDTASGSGSGSGSAGSRDTAATHSSGTNASGYGVLLAHPTLSLPRNLSEQGQAGNPFDAPDPVVYANLPPGAGPPSGNGLGGGYTDAHGARRILSPAQMAVLVEEGERERVLPRVSEEGESRLSGIDEGEEGEAEVVVARRVALGGASPEPATQRRRSWIPRFSWLNNNSNANSARNSRDVEEEGGLLLFDAGAHSPSNSVSSPPPVPVAGPSGGASGSGSAGPSGEMREFGGRPLLSFLRPQSRAGSGSRPTSGVPAAAAAGPRPISGLSGMSSEGTAGTGGTAGSGKSGGTVFEDAVSTFGSRAASSSALRNEASAGLRQQDAAPGAQGGAEAVDPLDLPAPAPLAAFASSSQHSLHQTHSAHSLHSTSQASLTQTASASLTHQNTNTSISTTTTTLGSATAAAGHTPLKPERAYAHGPPGLEFAVAPNTSTGTGASGKSSASWDAAGLELGFSRPASHSKLGTFGSANLVPVPPVPALPSYAFGAPPGIRVVGASTSSTLRDGGVGGGSGGRSSAPHLSLDLDDAPPGAEGEWRLLGGSVEAGREWGIVQVEGGSGRRDTFGGVGLGAAQYHHPSGHSSEQGSFHSRVGASSLSSGSSAHARLASAQNSSSGHSHSLYPSSGSTSARARALARAGSVEGPMSPATSAFGHRVRDAGAGEHSGSSGSGGGRAQETSAASGEREHERSRSPRSPTSPLLAPWAGGLDPEWRPT
ncbi:hypothetical protein DFH07DRAFT_1014179 [Mycena maculata]|uniref:Uncharacterized protein n=1 Tax=Mycena maculata TaxID=230809 RepID=A0AAD7JKG4_9AGAR|nr:hypothetical protein DFH07DRAFT_1014179 [Mycena maculata]